MIKAGVLADEAELKRFQAEAETVARLDHAGILPVYEVGEHDGQRYFSMKLIEGGNLADKLDWFNANPRAAATLLAETAEAVHHAHHARHSSPRFETGEYPDRLRQPPPRHRLRPGQAG